MIRTRWGPAPREALPTAQRSPPGSPATAIRRLSYPGMRGAATLDHLPPAPCSTSGRYQRPSNELPTAQASSGVPAQMALRSTLSAAATSMGTTRQLRPSVSRLKARSPPLLLVAPTTQAVLRPQAVTPLSVALRRLPGAGTVDQLGPSSRRTNGWDGPRAWADPPTAHTAPEAVAPTAFSPLPGPPSRGSRTTVQRSPSQCSTSDR